MIQGLEYFWNRTWVDDKRIKLIICGSSSSWIINKIVKDKGGLHNRVTRKIRLMPFTLKESQQFLAKLGIRLAASHILKIYMTIGGIPFYLKQIILFFNVNGLFFDEFEEVFSSLFEDSESYKELVTLIAQHKDGIHRNDIEKKNKLTGKGGYLTKRLNDLEVSGFISSYMPFAHKRRGTFYKVTDEYCLFYLKWVEPIKSPLKHELESSYWLSIVNTPAYYNWSGYAFERICYKHMTQVKKVLNIDLAALGSPWQYQPLKNDENDGVQIDLLFNRKDQAITLCEIKYSDKPYVINKKYFENLINKRDVFIKQTKTNRFL